MISLIQGFINSTSSSEFATPMMQLDQEAQIGLLKILQEEQSSISLDQESKISDEVLRKFEELEYENQKLNQELIIFKNNMKWREKKMQYDIEIEDNIELNNKVTQLQIKVRLVKEIPKLKQEFIDLELPQQTEQSSLEKSLAMLNSLIDEEQRRNLIGIFAPIRNLGLELTQLIAKTNYLLEGDQKLKLDVHTQTDKKFDYYNFIKKQDSSFEEEILSSYLSSWKSQCSGII